MTAWDIWDSVPKALLKLLSQLPAPGPVTQKDLPVFPSLTCRLLPTQLSHPPGSPTAEDSHQLCDMLATSTGLPWP